jgi:hypothetical protein
MEGSKARQFQQEHPAFSARHKEMRASDSSVSWLTRPPLSAWTLTRILAALIGGLILRLWMMQAFPQAGGDTLVYGNIAKNILQHGQFALTDGSGVLHSTLIRLPGYPLFLAACFKLFGVANYRAIAWLQIVLELAACLLLADFVRRIWNPRAALNTLWLATMCPFTAVYSSAPLTESLTFDCIVLALWSLNNFLGINRNATHQQTNSCHPEPKSSHPEPESYHSESKSCHPEQSEGPTLPQPSEDHSAQQKPAIPDQARKWVPHLCRGTIATKVGEHGPEPDHSTLHTSHSKLALPLFTLAISAAALLRPDGALLAIALWPALIFHRNRSTPHTSHSKLKTAIIVAVLSILPFIAWTARNASTFHLFEPLAPRYATDPGEDPHLGWQHWVKTWCLDFTCTSEIYWNAPDGSIDFADLPGWAFNSSAQRAQTAQLFAEYNANTPTNQQITPSLDARFQALANQRAAERPIFVHVLMPLGRLADMLLRPRVENLTIDLRWWQYWLHRSETRFSYVYAGVNLLFLILGLWGFRYRPPLWPYMAAYFVLRCALLATIEAPETRYTLELFPMLFALGGIALQQIFRRQPKMGAQQ